MSAEFDDPDDDISRIFRNEQEPIPGKDVPPTEPPPAANGKDDADPLKAADLPAIVLALLGEPTTRGDPHWRFGRQGSLSIHMPTGKWFDHEAGKGGRLADLVLRARGGTREDAQAWLTQKNYTAEDAARLEAKIKADETRNRERQAKARKEAKRLVDVGAELYERYPELTHTHDYLKRKGIAHLDLGLTVVSRSDTSIRGLPEGHVLIVPMRDHPHGVLHSVEAIAGNGTKRFLKGSRTAGCFHMIGDDGALGTVLVCEGLATGASLYEATRLPVVVCFSCGNMAAVARIFARQGRVVICGDDDWSKPRNVGKERAIALHKELKRSWPNYGHALALPEFPGVERFADHKDFNDSARACGLEAVRDVVERAMKSAEPPPDVGEPPSDQEPPPPPAHWKFVDVGELAGEPVEQPRYVIAGRIPALEVALLTGDGSAGKTTIAGQLAVAAAQEKFPLDWLGAEIREHGPVMFVSAEERIKQMHYRIDAILRHHMLSYADVAGRIKLLCLPDDDATLACLNRDQHGREKIIQTSFFDWLLKQVDDVKPKLVMLESAVDLLDADEIKRRHVRAFLKGLKRLALPGDGAVLLLAHPSQQGIAFGSGLSGSTDWHNAVRARMYFAPPAAKRNGTDHDAEPTDPNLRELRVLKNQYGPAGEIVRLVWQNGVYVPPGTPSSAQAAAAEEPINEAFLRCLDAVTAQKVNVSFQNGSTNYAPTVFARMTEAHGVRKQALAEAMHRLFKAGRIGPETYKGSGRHEHTRIARKLPS
jgi:phage/plasmid primase-like uncharacterized protein/RecA-family ATPase